MGGLFGLCGGLGEKDVLVVVGDILERGEGCGEVIEEV